MMLAPRSWEMPPDFEVVNQSEVQLKTSAQVVALSCSVRLVKVPACRRPIFWFSAHNRNCDAGFVAFEPRSRQTMHLDFDSSPEKLHDTLAYVWDSGLFARHFVLNARGALRGEDEAAHEAVLVAPDGIATWSQATIDIAPRDAAAFRWSVPESKTPFLRWPASEIWKRLQPPLEDPHSEASFARRFALLSEPERRELMWKWARGDARQFKAVLLDALHSQEFWNHLLEDNELLLHLRGPQAVEIKFRRSTALDETSVSASLLETVERVWNWFGPDEAESNVMDARCTRDWLRRHEPFLDIRAPHPTAHEQLEAHLRWREWLEKHGD